jgi:hypothetical protein
MVVVRNTNFLKLTVLNSAIIKLSDEERPNSSSQGELGAFSVFVNQEEGLT